MILFNIKNLHNDEYRKSNKSTKKKKEKDVSNYKLDVRNLSSHAIVLLIIIIVKDLPEAITGCILFIVVHWKKKKKS